MGKIQILDQSTINQIAAGEVIERPASIVKELIENSIDALSTAITVEIKEGGISFIRITDNGEGINKDDIEVAFKRHATSKIKSALDLVTVSSLGFRGEALSSIAAVAMVELITKEKNSLLGSRYEIAGGESKEIEEVGVPDGTTFIIRNLFFNTPARRKFLKSGATEAGYISDIVSKIALSHPEIAIRFINNGKQLLNTSGNGNLKDVIYSVYGREIASSLLKVEFSNELIKINGFIGKPIISKGNRSFENYFINGRYIKSNMINEAIEEGFGNFMMQHKYPFAAIQFQVDPEILDVNVHPTKMELRFKNHDEIYPFIIDAVKDSLMEKQLIPKVTFENKEEKKEVLVPVVEKKAPEFFEEKRIIKEVELKEEIEYSPLPIPVKKEKTDQQISLFSEELLSEKARSRHKLLGQIFDTYWIIEYGEEMYIVDQHAAHEKVLYEKIMKRIKDRKVSTQNLAIPIILSLTLNEIEVLKSIEKELKEIGYEIEDFGGNEYAVRGVPFDLFSISKEELLKEIIDSLSEDNSIKKGSQMIIEKIASMSCKAAVKGNHKMSYEEANSLMDQLLKLENPYNCPHGRPTIISMTKYELEKKFKRII